MDHDALLKSILHSLSNRVIPMLTGSRTVEQLSIEFSSVARRLPDLVARLEDGRILHLELQTTNDRRMPSRMLEYWLLLSERFPAREIVQVVLYVGYAKLRMPPGYTLPYLKYRYALVDIRQWDAADLLASPSPTERILAILCASMNVRKTIREVLRSWQGTPRRELASLLKKLMILSRLRKLEKSITKEYRTMPLTVDLILENTVFREWMEKGLKEGRQEGLQLGEATLLRRQMERRFGRLPAAAVKRIDTAETKLLEKWALQLLDAKTIEDVFAASNDRRSRK